jgi:hypothetical protein
MADRASTENLHFTLNGETRRAPRATSGRHPLGRRGPGLTTRGQCLLSQCLERGKPVAEAPTQENSEQTKPVGLVQGQ